MIIFDLDGTLANCEHRKHFIDSYRDQSSKGYIQQKSCSCEYPHSSDPWIHKETGKKWKPDWESFFEACDEDTPIEPVVTIWNHYEVPISLSRDNLQIWSGRSESVRKKTVEWLERHLFGLGEEWWEDVLKMRPIGDTTSDDILKSKWLDDVLSQGKKIDFVFDDRPKVVRMWRERGIFVFNCNQTDDEF